MGGKPKIPDAAPPPAARPERQVEVQPEDVQLGDADSQGSNLGKNKGKRSLMRPTGTSAPATSGLAV